jgi:hypothetical protein
MNKILGWVGRSFDNLPGGASAKKLTAFLFTVLCIWIHFKFCTLTNAIDFLISDQVLIAALLGASTFESIKGKKQPETTKPEGD